MTALPSGFIPSLGGLSTLQNTRKKKIQFGDGYSQISVNTVNSKKITANLTFIVWGDSDLNILLGFFDSLAGDTLTYTFPNEVNSQEYHVDNVKVDYLDLMQRSVKVDISS